MADEKQPSLLLIDESKGRVVAESMKLTITGSIGILFAAYQKKLLTADEIDQSVTMLRGMNRFIGERLFNLLLSLVHDKFSELIRKFGWRTRTKEQMLERFIATRPKEPLLSEEEIMADVSAVRYAK
ncbi:hypothetical protein [uncultured Fibrobacter sp.]|uniref:hypothetical protein n=1 Tax=uncultured Fibrobacter sp. TaxID=261512 RepID=UPI0025EB78D8|nr:hypothetical protein [uncultured Fibrobacter sp.]